MGFLADGGSGRFSNFPEIAGFYSQLAGVLAGFAFAGLITLVASQLVTGSRADLTLRGYRPLIAAFLGLVATSLNYAIVAGEDRDTRRLASLEVTAGLGFCVAGLTVLYSILVLLRGVERDLTSSGRSSGKSADLLRGTLIFGVCPLLTVMMYGAISDHVMAKYQSPGLRGIEVAVLVVLLVTLAYIPFAVRCFTKPATSTVFVNFVSRFSVSTAVFSLLASTLTISFVDTDYAIPDLVPLTCICLLGLFNLVVMYSAARYRP